MKRSPAGRMKVPVLPDGTEVRVPAAFLVADVETGSWRWERPVVDPSKCSRCGICEKFCPLQIISLGTGSPTIDLRFCKGCGICANECPRKAITMTSERQSDSGGSRG